MAIYDLSDGRFRVQVDVGTTYRGKRDRRSKVCATLKEARKVERDFQRIAEDNAGISDRARFDAFVSDVWWPEKRAVCKSNTIDGYARDVNLRLLPAFGRMEVSDIKRMHVQRMLSGCATKKTAQNARSTLHNILALAVDLELVSHNAADGQFRYPKPAPHTQRERESVNGEWITSFEGIADFLDAARGDACYPVAVLGLCFGLRKGEILGLEWEDVDFDARSISVMRTWTYSSSRGCELTAPKTDSSLRTVPMSDFAYGRMRELQAMRDTDVLVLHEPVVTSGAGERPSPKSSADKLARFTRANDVPRVTMFSLRHSFATSAIRAGCNVASVSKWLGHSDITVTMRKYVKPLERDLKLDVADIIDRSISSESDGKEQRRAGANGS